MPKIQEVIPLHNTPDFEKDTLYIPLGLKLKPEIFDGYGKTELLQTILATLAAGAADFLLFKNWIYGRRHKFQGLVAVYFALTSLMMALLVGSQIYWVATELVNRYKSSNNILEFLLKIKLAIAVVFIIAVRIMFKSMNIIVKNKA